jgi:membrane fusion protein, multidrug efflux system
MIRESSSSSIPARRAAWLLTGLVALTLAGCGKDDAPAGGAPGGGGGGGPGGGDRPVPVVTQRVQPQSFTERYSAIGTVKARESVTVTAKVSEIVQQVHFDSGDTVRAGAPLVTLSGQQQQAALAEAQAAADEAERLYRRQSELAQQQLIARAQLDNQRAARDAANARVAQIRAQLAERVIRAPFAGVLGLRQVSPGALVTPGTAIATLDAMERVYVDFPMPESQLARAVPGLQVGGSVAAYPDRRFEGRVVTVDTRLDPVARSATVRADFPNATGALRPGMLVSVELDGIQRSALLVPEIAVVQVGRESFVYRVKDDSSVEQVKIAVGARSDGRAEVIEGVRAGDRIVVEGTSKLRPGARVDDAPAMAPVPPATPAPGAASVPAAAAAARS